MAEFGAASKVSTLRVSTSRVNVSCFFEHLYLHFDAEIIITPKGSEQLLPGNRGLIKEC